MLIRSGCILESGQNDVWVSYRFGLLVGVVFGLPSDLTRLVDDPRRGVEPGVIMTISDSHEQDEASEENEEEVEGQDEKELLRVSSFEAYGTGWLNIVITKDSGRRVVDLADVSLSNRCQLSQRWSTYLKGMTMVGDTERSVSSRKEWTICLDRIKLYRKENNAPIYHSMVTIESKMASDSRLD